MDFVGQRADKIVVVDSTVKEVEDEYGMTKNGVVKEVVHYTMDCNECDGDGYYDQNGEVICEGCGMVLSGDRQATLSTEFSEGSDSVGRGRGLEKMDRDSNKTTYGTHEPSV